MCNKKMQQNEQAWINRFNINQVLYLIIKNNQTQHT
jgi:hypothetical protein